MVRNVFFFFLFFLSEVFFNELYYRVIITDFDAFILGLNPHSNWSRWMHSVMSKRRVDGKCVLPKFYTVALRSIALDNFMLSCLALFCSRKQLI